MKKRRLVSSRVPKRRLYSGPLVIADTRESHLIKRILADLNTEVVEKAITPADYVLSDDFAIERKQFQDFLRSVFDGRLFEQAERLTKTYKHSLLVVEGDVSQGLLETSNPMVFWGALAKVLSEWNLSVIFTSRETETAMFIHSLAQKLQEEKKTRISVKHKPKAYTLGEKQLRVICALPNIGPERAKRLLTRFGSVRKILRASKSELLSVDGIGEKTIRQIMDLIDTKYPGFQPI